MRKAITLLTLVFMTCGTNLLAQHSSLQKQWLSGSIDLRYKAALERLSALVPCTGTAGKPTAPGQRLTGMVTDLDRGNGLAPIEVTYFSYSGTRTSTFDKTSLSYGTEYSYSPFRPERQVDFDTSYYRDLIAMTGTDTAYVQRNAAGKVTRLYQSGYSGYEVQDYTYDAPDRPTAMVTKQYNNQTMALVNTGRTGYNHDAQGRLVADTIYSWSSALNQWEPSKLQLYSYNAANLPTQELLYNWTGTAFVPEQRTSVSYTATNQYSAGRFDSWNGSAYVFEGMDSVAYGAGNAVVYYVLRTQLNGSPVVSYEEKRQLNAAGLPDSITVRQLHSQLTLTYDTYYQRLTWNSFGNPVSRSNRNAVDASPSSVLRYYYDGAQVSLGLASATVRKSLRIFPNPADHQISIRPDFSGHYSCRITNATGQLMQRSTGTAVDGEAIVLPLDKLAPGQYLLQLRDGAGASYSTPFIRR